MQRLKQDTMFDDQPPATDLSRLRIARGAAQQRQHRPLWRRVLVPALIVLALAIAAAVIYRLTLGAPPEVETTAVTLAYPYQAHSTLNATGYVVAQRKASVASTRSPRRSSSFVCFILSTHGMIRKGGAEQNSISGSPNWAVSAATV